VARGLIVQTTTTTPSDGALAATDDALGSKADVATDDKLTGKISTIDFDQTVSTEVASKVADEVAKRADIVWAAPNTLRQHQAASPTPVNDPYFPNQRNVWDSTATSPAGGYSVKAPSLWRKTTGSDSAQVAVLDTGILPNPDLDGQVVPGWDMISADTPMALKNAGDGGGRDGDPTDPGDWATAGYCGRNSPAYPSSWHGTFVAGQVAAKADNGIGIAGVAPGVKVQPVRVLGHCGGWDSDIIAGITWASGGHVAGVPDNATPSQVLNLSLGSTYDTKAERDEFCVPYAAAASAARARGSVIVAAAGNDGANANLAVPASCSGFVSVGATSLKGFSSIYSNIGSTVDISAPGGDTLVEGAGDSVLGLGNTGKTGAAAPAYVRYEGTSMAAPEVSAGAALLRSLLDTVGTPTASEVETALYASVSPFRAKSSTYANKRVVFNGDAYYVDLNCTGHSWCGRGLLDLSRVEVPLTPTTITGDVRIGEPLTATAGSWVRVPADPYYIWMRDGEPITGAYSKVYHPTQQDVGKSLTVTIQPRTYPFSKFPSTSAATVPVPAGPDVWMTTSPDPITYGKPFTTTVEVVADYYQPDQVIDNGEIQIRRADGTVVATGTTHDVAPQDGQPNRVAAEITIPGTAWKPGTDLLRAAYLGAGSTPAASSEQQPFAIRRVVPGVATSLATRVRHTSHASVRVTVTAPPFSNPGPTGTIQVFDGSRRIVSTTLYGSALGRKTIRLPLLKKGAHSIKVKFGGNTYVASKYSISRRITSY